MNYERINWENSPSTDTPLDADNLNKMDEGLDTLNREVQKTRNDLAKVEESTDVLSARMSAFARLQEGSTTGDAELIDGRIGKDGTEYDTLGNAIRGQVRALAESVPAIDADLETAGDAADAKATGDALSSLNERLGDLDERVEALEAGGSGSGLTEDIKAALLQLASKVAYIDEHGQDYYDDLEAALYPPADLVGISAVYTQSKTVYDTDTLDSLKVDLVVTARYSDGTTGIITNYTLTGTLMVGESVVTVNYGGISTTFTVTVNTEENTIQYEIGTVNTEGVDAESTNRVRTDFIAVNSGDLFVIGMDLNFVLRVYDSSKNYIKSIPSSGWASKYRASIDMDGYVRILMRKADDGEFINGELDGSVFEIGNKIYFMNIPKYAEQGLPVYLGKGYDSETWSIIDNVNRAITDAVSVNTGQSIFMAYKSAEGESDLELGLKHLDANNNVVSPFTVYYTPNITSNSFGISANKLYMESTNGGNYIPRANDSPKIRFIIAHRGRTTPVAEVPRGKLIINNQTYRFVQGEYT